jgi:formylglycine-generating enzyme required for sulfatase activity
MTTDVDPDSQSNEQPAHPVTVSTFYLDRTEVTVGAYAECVAAMEQGQATAMGCTLPDNMVNNNAACNWGAGGAPDMAGDRTDYPINCVDWNQATAYCRWKNKRLPTEEEWEYAARGVADSKYPWGNKGPVAANQVCWSGNGMNPNGTCPVGMYAATLQGADHDAGLLDMAGNVWEWTNSQSGSYPNHQNCNGDCVIRGGSWYNDDPKYLRAAFRDNHGAMYRDGDVGFRCARPE